MSSRQVCVRHPGRSGIGLCMSCGCVVCEECGGREEGILRCRRCLTARVLERASNPGTRRFRDFVAGAFVLLTALSLLVALFFQVLRVAALWGS